MRLRGERMTQESFDREVLTRLTQIETKIEMLLKECPINQARLHDAEIKLRGVESSVKSAHYRIDGMYKVAGAIGAVVSLLINVLAFVMKGG